MIEQDGYFAVMSVHRDDIAAKIGDEAADALTDDKMREIADGMWNDLMAELFIDSLESTLESMGFTILKTGDDDDGVD